MSEQQVNGQRLWVKYFCQIWVEAGSKVNNKKYANKCPDGGDKMEGIDPCKPGTDVFFVVGLFYAAVKIFTISIAHDKAAQNKKEIDPKPAVI